MKKNRCFSVLAASAATVALGQSVVFAGDDPPVDEYLGGVALVVLLEEFTSPIGASILGANYPFPGNPAPPTVGGGLAPLFTLDQSAIVGYIKCDVTNNGGGNFTVSYEAIKADYSPNPGEGTAWVTPDTNIVLDTPFGPQEANELVIDLGNGYQQAGFPVDGVQVASGGPSTVFCDVEQYYFERVDGTINNEAGDTEGPYIQADGQFTFAWGFDLADAREIKRMGFVVNFTVPSACPDCPDLNGDCVVDGADLTLLLGVWGTDDPQADFDNSGDVDGADLAVILGGWGDC